MSAIFLYLLRCITGIASDLGHHFSFMLTQTPESTLLSSLKITLGNSHTLRLVGKCSHFLHTLFMPVCQLGIRLSVSSICRYCKSCREGTEGVIYFLPFALNLATLYAEESNVAPNTILIIALRVNDL